MNLAKRLKSHFETDPAKLPLIAQTLGMHERPNLHVALEEMLGELPICAATKVMGIVEFENDEASLAKLSRSASARLFDEGPIEHVDFSVDNGTKLACVKRGLFLLDDGKGKVAMLIGDTHFSHPSRIKIEVMAAERDHAEKFLRKLVDVTRQGKAYRGKVLSIERDCYGETHVKFHSLPKIGRGEIILPETVLRRLERHTIDFSRQLSRLREAKRHIKRGVLLHGPPGTGKTLSAMYLAAEMPERTVILMTGAGVGAIEVACNLARMLEPATVVLEDVDLIGARREHQVVDANALLFELLNHMDGLAEDIDILFILTTNRPDILEPALASRPGRIDQAIEIPLPDEECRERLFDLYSRGLRVEANNRRRLIENTAGASAAFVRELLRKAAVLAAIEQPGEIVVRDGHFEDALAELLVAGGSLTKSLLGASQAVHQ